MRTDGPALIRNTLCRTFGPPLTWPSKPRPCGLGYTTAGPSVLSFANLKKLKKFNVTYAIVSIGPLGPCPLVPAVLLSFVAGRRLEPRSFWSFSSLVSFSLGREYGTAVLRRNPRAYPGRGRKSRCLHNRDREFPAPCRSR